VNGRNLRAIPAVVVHIQDGLDAVMVEGTATPEANPEVLGELPKDYAREYDYRPDWSKGDAQVVFGVQPLVAHAWHSPKIHPNLVDFVFGDDASGRSRE